MTLLRDRFHVTRELGRGARGIVYLASDQVKGTEVAVKLFASSEVSANELQNEFKLLSQVHDDSLTEVYDLGFDDETNCYFLAEEYFPGQPLNHWTGQLGFEKLASLTAHLCRTLQLLHYHGIFHGDLKPSNVLMHRDRIKLVDFGLAQRLEETQKTVSDTLVSGTLPYMAPELFLGGKVDVRADLYALGATLYELVSGHPPFMAPTLSRLIEQHLFETPTMPLAADSPIPKEFGYLILRLLSKDPDDRFAEANDVIRSLNLSLHFNFPLGPEPEVLPKERREQLAQQHLLRLHEQAIRFYQDKTDPESRRLLAEIYFRQGNWLEAESLVAPFQDTRSILLKLQIGLKRGRFAETYEAALPLLQTTLTDEQRGALYNAMGTSLYYLGRYHEAEESFEMALGFLKQAKAHRAEASLLNNLGNLRIQEGKWQEAVSLYRQSVALCRDEGDIPNEGLFLMSLGYAYHLAKDLPQGGLPKALGYYQQSEALLEAIGDRAPLAKVKGNLANLYIEMGSLEKGEEKLLEAEVIAREKGDPFTQAYTTLLRGDLWRKKGDPGRALAAYQEGKRQFAHLGSTQEEAMAERNIQELQGGSMGLTPLGLTTRLPIKESSALSPLLRRILSINRRLSLLDDLPEALELIMDSMIEFTGAERGYLILKEKGAKVVRVSREIESAEAESTQFSSSLVDRVLRTGEPLITLDALADERFSRSLSIHKLRLRSVVCIPFRARDEVMGAVYLENRLQCGTFTQDTIDLMQAFADQAAIAIARAGTMTELMVSQKSIRELNEQLTQALGQKEVELGEIKQDLVRKQSALELKYRYDEIIGRSAPMVELLKLLDRVTESDIPVFLFGESGTGKELITRAIHFNGPRSKKAFVPINCSALPENLLESELFGCMQGAYTGADRDRPGLFETADGGTLFLDEIGDMPLAMQAKLLRVLQEKEVRRVGGKSMVKVDVRILSASHQDLKDLVREKKFREDLFYRLQAVRLKLPPLRERLEDIPLLVDHFLSKFNQSHRGKKKSITREAFELLQRYRWPGNIRELENVLNNVALLSEGNRLEVSDFRQKEELWAQANQPTLGKLPLVNGGSFRTSVEQFEKSLIEKVLSDCRGNITRAATELQMARPQLSRMVKKYGLKAEAP